MKVKVQITAEDGSVLDTFSVEIDELDTDVQRMDLAHDVRKCVEEYYPVKDVE